MTNKPHYTHIGLQDITHTMPSRSVICVSFSVTNIRPAARNNCPAETDVWEMHKYRYAIHCHWWNAVILKEGVRCVYIVDRFISNLFGSQCNWIHVAGCAPTVVLSSVWHSQTASTLQLLPTAVEDATLTLAWVSHSYQNRPAASRQLSGIFFSIFCGVHQRGCCIWIAMQYTFFFLDRKKWQIYNLSLWTVSMTNILLIH